MLINIKVPFVFIFLAVDQLQSEEETRLLYRYKPDTNNSKIF